MDGTGPRVLVIEARFYPELADELYAGAADVLSAYDAQIERVTVPGVLEIPAALAYAIEGTSGEFDRGYNAFVLLGCVIRGETSHYDIVAGESARAVMDLAVKHRLCLGNGILTVEDSEQAWERADRRKKDKGGAAARAALDMMSVRASLIGDD
ncbi:6,7-dimethyl-8-ribityllumazine synthase [Lutibaculum baratangense]|uniref:6,7-dimethyl-8-ribityllumazine synthase n=1 Tax=Lutibaculum baratangense AMV1 TaxID=631454 RepID=V4RCZ6_9HYPH|nr:6,7-dimethyl-8-ribityllumazine synthase [Lutibaculum baratangense]ESR23269.1 6,7-dimethyl-8-ribityllumazine synthase [Lutibaculum baratangense AMV1]